jgi:hypothetical protein
MPLTRFGLIAKAHLKEHRPKLYRQLQKEGRLDQFAQERADAAQRVLDELVKKGYPHDGAWEIAKDEIYLPTEEDVPHLGENPQPYQ